MAAALASVLGTASQADELQVGARISTEYDTAAIGREGRRLNAWEVNVGPQVRLRRDRGPLRYDVRYEADYEYLFEGGGRNTWDHQVSARAAWQPDSRTSLSLSNDFSRIEGPTFVQVSDEGVTGVTDVDDATQRLTSSSTDLQFARFLTPRLQMNTTLNHSLADFDNEQRFDNQVFGASSYLAWRASPRLGLEFGGGSSYQVVEGSLGQPGSRTLVHRVFGGWNLDLTRSLSLNVRGGPSLVQSSPSPGGGGGLPVSRFQPVPVPDAGTGVTLLGLVDVGTCSPVEGRLLLSTCSRGDPDDLIFLDTNDEPVALFDAEGNLVQASDLVDFRDVRAVSLEDAGAGDSSSLRAYAEASLDWTQRKWSGSLRYRRTEEPSTLSGGSTAVDSLTGFVRWRPRQRWTLVLSANWSQRRSTTEQTVPGALIVVDSGLDGRATAMGPDLSIAEVSQVAGVETENAIDRTSWGAVLRVSRDMSENVRATLDLRYFEQDEQGDFRARQELTRFVGRLVLRWNLAPLVF